MHPIRLFEAALLGRATLSILPHTVEQTAEEMAEHGIAWLEEPLPPDDHEGYLALKQKDIVPLASGEHEPSEERFLDLILLGAVDYVVKPDDPEGMAMALAGLAILTAIGQDYERAAAFAEESLVRARAACLPGLIAHCLHESIHCLSNGISVFVEKCVAGIEADAARCRELVDRSLMLVTALNPYIGYDAAAAVAKEAFASGKTLREVVLARGLLDPATLDAVLDPRSMIKPSATSVSAGGG